jgi:hypothetical protein
MLRAPAAQGACNKDVIFLTLLYRTPKGFLEKPFFLTEREKKSPSCGHQKN